MKKEEEELNFMLIQNNKILVIFSCLLAKLQPFQDYRALLLCASDREFFFESRSSRKRLAFAFYNFTMLQKQQKVFTHAGRAIGIKQFHKRSR